MRRRRCAPRVTAVGWDHVDAAMEAGKGLILALPHLGGFDFAAAYLAELGLAPTVVVEPVEPPELFEWFADVRRAIGMEVVPLGPTAAPTVLRRAQGQPGGLSPVGPRHQR